MDILAELKRNHQEIRSIVQHARKSQGSQTWERRILNLAASLSELFAFERNTILKRLDDLTTDSGHVATENRKQTTLLNELYALLDTASVENFSDTRAAFCVIEQDIEDHLSYVEDSLSPLFRITVSFREQGRTGPAPTLDTPEHYNRLI